MDYYFHRFLDRDVFDPVFVVPAAENTGELVYDPSMDFVYTGDDYRFEKLMSVFHDTDVVTFSGGFSPIICEAAKTAEVPVLIEIMHDTESGQVYPHIAVSLCVSETVRSAQPHREKTRVIYNGIDIDEFPFREEPSSGDKIVILQVSNRGKTSFNLDDIADRLLALDPRVELWLAGKDQTLPSTPRVKFLGLQKNINDIYRQADMLALFPRVEAFGLVVTEAMATGVLPVVFDTLGPSEIVTNGHDGWLAKTDDRDSVISTIANAIKLRDTAIWQTMRKNARETVETKFSIRRCVKDYETAILEFVERNGRKDKAPLTHFDIPPEAYIDDAIYYHRKQMWEKVSETARKLAENPAPITIPICRWATEKLASQAIMRDDYECANYLFAKLFVSGFREAQWMKLWLHILPESAPKSMILREILKLDPADAEAIMSLAEIYLGMGAFDQAAATIENGLKYNSGSTELNEVRELLNARLKV